MDYFTILNHSPNHYRYAKSREILKYVPLQKDVNPK